VGHAISALGVLGVPVLIPRCLLHQRFEAGRVAFIDQEVTGLLPTEDITGRVTPRGTVIALVAGQEIEVKTGMVEVPALSLAQLEDVSEEFLAVPLLDENVLLRRMFIAEAGGNRCAFDTQCLAVIEEAGDFFRPFPLEQGAVHGDPETAADGQLDGIHGPIKDAFLTDGGVMTILVAIQMDGERQIRGGLVVIDALFQKERIGAKVNIFARAMMPSTTSGSSL